MKNTGLLFLLLIAACGPKKRTPDVSNIKIDLQTIRFEKDFFALDTNNIDVSLQKLTDSHKGFTQDFLFNILGTQPNVDSATKDVRAFC